MVHVPKTIALISCLHVFCSAVLSGVRKCFGTGKRINILGSRRDYFLGRMRPIIPLKHGGGEVFGVSTSKKATHLVAGPSKISLFLFSFPE